LVNGNCITGEPETEPVECPYGMAPNKNNVCRPCHYTCRTCLTPLHPNRCSSCSRGKRLVGGTCVPFKVRYKKFKRPQPHCPELMASINGVCKCIRGYVGNSLSPSASDTYCLPCDPSCLTCYKANNPNACTSCYRWMYPLNGRCLPKPPTPNPIFTCSPVCESCAAENDPEQCTSCTMANSLLTQGKCYCPAGTYNLSNTCVESCAFPCTECFINDNAICTACPEGLIPLGGACVCPNSTAMSPIMPLDVLRSSDDQLRCLPCDISCTTCSEPENPLACTECNDPRATLTNGECLCPDAQMEYNAEGLCECPLGTTDNNGACLGIPCPPGTFPNGNICAPCEIPNCIVCESLEECAECEVGYYLSEGICFQCPVNCVACVGPDECEVCEEGFELVDGQCVESCPPCCLTCTFDTRGPTCTSCINNYVFTNGQCATCSEGIPNCANCRNCVCTRCEAGYYLLNATLCRSCSLAIPFCRICNGPDTCLQCEDGYYFDATLRRCMQSVAPLTSLECPEGTYRSKRGDCYDCYFNCKNCIGPGQSMCTECYPNSILYPELGFTWGRCICRGGFWFDRDRKCCRTSTSPKPRA
jgi:proprotein convertase subtilisin/kexin type 5